MFYKKRIDKIYEISKENAKERAKHIGDEDIKPERGDMLAMYLAALKVFWPILAVLLVLLIVAYVLTLG